MFTIYCLRLTITILMSLRARRSIGEVRYCFRAMSVSVSHKPVLIRNGWTDQTGFWRGGLLRPLVHCCERIEYLRYFIPNCVLQKFRCTSIVAACCQLGSTTVFAECGRLAQRRSHTSGVRGVRTPCQENTYLFGM